MQKCKEYNTVYYLGLVNFEEAFDAVCMTEKLLSVSPLFVPRGSQKATKGETKTKTIHCNEKGNLK